MQMVMKVQRIPLNKKSSSASLQYGAMPIDYDSDDGQPIYDVYRIEACVNNPPILPEDELAHLEMVYEVFNLNVYFKGEGHSEDLCEDTESDTHSIIEDSHEKPFETFDTKACLEDGDLHNLALQVMDLYEHLDEEDSCQERHEAPESNLHPDAKNPHGIVCESFNLEGDESSSTCSIGTEDQAKDYYWQLLESEHLREFRHPYVGASIMSKHPSFLAMVTAKIQGQICNRPCTMLIDMGSELNIMTSKQAYALELPVDPTGTMWTLQGVSGRQVALEGLCRDVPLTIGGIEVAHNFFIT